MSYGSSCLSSASTGKLYLVILIFSERYETKIRYRLERIDVAGQAFNTPFQMKAPWCCILKRCFYVCVRACIMVSACIDLMVSAQVNRKGFNADIDLCWSFSR